jgi:hypothetical protein
MSNSPPSGLRSKTSQISRLSTKAVIWGSTPYSSVSMVRV